MVGAVLVTALLGAFALELANTQAKSKSAIKVQVHQRAVLAAGLIDSLFQSTGNNIGLYSKEYGTPTVSEQVVDKAVGTNLYVAVLGAGRTVLAASSGFPVQARSDPAVSMALDHLSSPYPYGLGNYTRYGKTGSFNLAIAFRTPYGPRVLISGVNADPHAALAEYFHRTLAAIPGVKGSVNALIDANDVRISSSNPAKPVGTHLSVTGTRALTHSSGEVNGYYFDATPLLNSTWRIVLASPTGPLFANVTGLHWAVPWLIFAAFALVAIVALILGERVLRSADQLQTVNSRLARAADELQMANSQLTHANSELAISNTALERQAAELVRSNEELDQFASIASHDLQEPLRKVRAFNQQVIATESERLSQKGRDYLDRANSAAERMQNLIEDLLKFSRVSTQGQRFELVDLEKVTRDVLSDLETQVMTSRATVHVGRLSVIEGDRVQMRQLIQNLMSNALKFRRDGVDPEVHIESDVDGENLHLRVRDNGIGFDPQYNMRIFRVFERLNARSEYPGTGIGLALCRKIADRHGGTITAEGARGSGATFTVTLPLSHCTPEMISNAETGNKGSAQLVHANSGA